MTYGQLKIATLNMDWTLRRFVKNIKPYGRTDFVRSLVKVSGGPTFASLECFFQLNVEMLVVVDCFQRFILICHPHLKEAFLKMKRIFLTILVITCFNAAMAIMIGKAYHDVHNSYLHFRSEEDSWIRLCQWSCKGGLSHLQKWNCLIQQNCKNYWVIPVLQEMIGLDWDYINFYSKFSLQYWHKYWGQKPITL